MEKNLIFLQRSQADLQANKCTHAEAKQENGRSLYPVGKTDLGLVIFTVFCFCFKERITPKSHAHFIPPLHIPHKTLKLKRHLRYLLTTNGLSHFSKPSPYTKEKM